MDEVPIANNNPVNLIIKKPESAPRKTELNRIKESLKNFFIMLPLALLVVAQFYFLGKKFREFSTFPVTGLISYIFAGDHHDTAVLTNADAVDHLFDSGRCSIDSRHLYRLVW